MKPERGAGERERRMETVRGEGERRERKRRRKGGGNGESGLLLDLCDVISALTRLLCHWGSGVVLTSHSCKRAYVCVRESA